LSKCNSEPILELNDTNFEEYKAKNEYLLIYFHASYSQESISLQKHFIEIPKYLNKTKPIVYGIISQKNYYVNHKYKVEFPYPRILLINKDNNYVYKGEIKTDSIAEWVMR
jgi:hypothetical protein